MTHTSSPFLKDLDPAVDPLINSILADRYRLIRKMGQGGMGSVYEGVHQIIGKRVAIKFLHPQFASNAEVLARFVNEARAAAMLGHPNIVESIDVGRAADGSPYVVLEFLEGQSLGDALKAGPLSPQRTVDVLLPALSALSLAHQRGIVHRDLKPDNIFLAMQPDGGEVPKVLDFGISKFGGTGGGATMAGAMLGTPSYMSPEQFKDSSTVGPLSDVYSMGVILFECLSGRLPFESQDLRQLISDVSTQPPQPLETTPPVPHELQAVVMRCLEKDASQRFQSMQELAAALSHLSLGGIPAGAPVGASQRRYASNPQLARSGAPVRSSNPALGRAVPSSPHLSPSSPALAAPQAQRSSPGLPRTAISSPRVSASSPAVPAPAAQGPRVGVSNPGVPVRTSNPQVRTSNPQVRVSSAGASPRVGQSAAGQAPGPASGLPSGGFDPFAPQPGAGPAYPDANFQPYDPASQGPAYPDASSPGPAQSYPQQFVGNPGQMPSGMGFTQNALAAALPTPAWKRFWWAGALAVVAIAGGAFMLGRGGSSTGAPAPVAPVPAAAPVAQAPAAPVTPPPAVPAATPPVAPAPVAAAPNNPAPSAPPAPVAAAPVTPPTPEPAPAAHRSPSSRTSEPRAAETRVAATESESPRKSSHASANAPAVAAATAHPDPSGGASHGQLNVTTDSGVKHLALRSAAGHLQIAGVTGFQVGIDYTASAGSLSAKISSDPWAIVYVNGSSLGKTPISLPPIQSSPVRVELQRPGSDSVKMVLNADNVN